MTAWVHSRLVLRTLVKLPECAGGLTPRFFLSVSVPQNNSDFIPRRLIMQRISVLLLLLVACFSTAMRGQAPAPKPDPALKKLSVYLGHWTCEVESKAGPLGPGGKVTSEESFQMILGGFFQQLRGDRQGTYGRTKS